LKFRAAIGRFWSEFVEVAGLILDIPRYGGLRLMLQYLRSLVLCCRAVWKSRTLFAADLGMKSISCRVQCGENRVSLPGLHFGQIREIFGRRAYWRDPVMRIGPEDTVVDVGANVGVFSVAAAAMAWRGRVVSIEAQGGFICDLRRHLRENRLEDRVSVLHAVVGPGIGWFAQNQGRDGSHFAGEPRALPLSKLVEEHGLDRIDFLKMDIEGSEFAAFEDAPGWLPRVRRIAMEVHLEHGRPELLEDLLHRHGFRTWRRENPRQLAQLRVLLLYAVRQ
jgi:FkbM family methyltransferase